MKVAKEVAEQEFDRLCQAWRVSTDTESMSTAPAKTKDGDGPSELEAFEEIKSKVVRRIMLGSLTVDESGIPTYTPPIPSGKPLTFRKLDGAILISSGRKKNDMEKIADMIAGMTQKPPVEIAKLDAPDLLFCGTLISLFLGAE